MKVKILIFTYTHFDLNPNCLRCIVKAKRSPCYFNTFKQVVLDLMSAVLCGLGHGLFGNALVRHSQFVTYHGRMQSRLGHKFFQHILATWHPLKAFLCL